MSRPPRSLEWILARLIPSEDREEVLGDLAESFQHRAQRGRVRASFWYLAQVVLVPAWIAGSVVTSARLDATEVRRIVRHLVASPAFTLMAVLSLGLGIGATTAIFGAVEALLLTTLPVERPEEIRLIYHTWPERWERGQYGSSSTDDPHDGARVVSNVSFPAWELLEREVPADVGLAAYSFVREMALVAGDAPALAAGGMLVSGSYFATLGLTTETGRPLDESDDRPGAAPVAVLSHSFWQRAFGGDPSVVGRTVRLNEAPYEIVGVAKKGYIGLSPGGFSGPSDVILPMTHHDAFIAINLGEGETLRTSALTHWVRLIARIPEGVDADGLLRSWTDRLAGHMVEAGVIQPEGRPDMTLRVLDGSRGLDSLRRDTRAPLGVLSVVVGLVLLIACANLSTILLARGATRAEELAVRRALGASRWELARPQLVESLLLALAGGAVGLTVALNGGPLLVASLTGGSGTAASSYQMSWSLASAALLAAFLAAGLSGALPALRQMKADPAENLGARSSGGSVGRFRMGRALIALQLAISVPLVVGAGLFLRTLDNLVSIDPGFDPENLTVFRVDASLITGDREEEQSIYERILAGLEEVRGVRSAAIVENVLVSGYQSNGNVIVDGREDRVMMDWNAMSPGFFETMGVELLSGRPLRDSDDEGAPHVALVNATAEREVFDGRALGRRIRFSSGREMEIVGVVADTKYTRLRDPVQPAFYDPWTQRPGGLFRTNFVVRTDGARRNLESVVREIVADAHPGLPVTGFRAQGDEIEAQARRERVFARLLTAFGAFALLLSCVGLHGLMSFSVAQRRAEMGVRLALGAAPLSIVTLVLRQVAGLTALGLAIGMLVALQVGPTVRAMLFGIEPDDGTTLLAVGLVMAGVALLAGAIPALRASRVDPLKSLAP